MTKQNQRKSAEAPEQAGVSPEMQRLAACFNAVVIRYTSLPYADRIARTVGDAAKLYDLTAANEGLEARPVTLTPQDRSYLKNELLKTGGRVSQMSYETSGYVNAIANTANNLYQTALASKLIAEPKS